MATTKVAANNEQATQDPPEKKTMELKLMALTWITMNDQTNEKKKQNQQELSQ